VTVLRPDTKGDRISRRDINDCKARQSPSDWPRSFVALPPPRSAKNGHGIDQVMTDVRAERYWPVVAEVGGRSSIEPMPEMTRHTMADPALQRS